MKTSERLEIMAFLMAIAEKLNVEEENLHKFMKGMNKEVKNE